MIKYNMFILLSFFCLFSGFGLVPKQIMYIKELQS